MGKWIDESTKKLINANIEKWKKFLMRVNRWIIEWAKTWMNEEKNNFENIYGKNEKKF